MAEEEDGRTEQASQRRLNKAFEEGDIPFGRDALAAGNLVFALGALSAVGKSVQNLLTELMRERFTALADVAHGPANQSGGLFMKIILLMLGVCASAATGAIAVGLVQTRGEFWPDKLAPDLTRLWSPRIGQLFSLKLFTDIGMAILKVSVIVAAVSGMWRDRFMALPTLMTAPQGSLLSIGGAWLMPLLMRAVGAAALIAGLDFALQTYRFTQRMKMTREELKREGKEDSGDPMLKGKRRRRMRELSRSRVAIEVPRADALLVNPTHVAIAIRYRKEEGLAPRVIAKGKGKLAEIMRDLARENGIAIVEDIPLARLLYKQVKVGRAVPAETFKAVAAILAFVYRLTGKRMGGNTSGKAA
jgi:flagellar biosynthetic protein FlhB